MKIINNITEKLLDDLKVEIMPQSKYPSQLLVFPSMHMKN